MAPKMKRLSEQRIPTHAHSRKTAQTKNKAHMDKRKIRAPKPVPLHAQPKPGQHLPTSTPTLFNMESNIVFYKIRTPKPVPLHAQPKPGQHLPTSTPTLFNMESNIAVWHKLTPHTQTTIGKHPKPKNQPISKPTV